jgi:hypothetical protein
MFYIWLNAEKDVVFYLMHLQAMNFPYMAFPGLRYVVTVQVALAVARGDTNVTL